MRDVHVATNRIDVGLHWAGRSTQPLHIVWEEIDGRLTGRLAHDGLLDRLPQPTAAALALALSGMTQRTGVEQFAADLRGVECSPISWTAWIQAWSAVEQHELPEYPHLAATGG